MQFSSEPQLPALDEKIGMGSTCPWWLPLLPPDPSGWHPVCEWGKECTQGVLRRSEAREKQGTPATAELLAIWGGLSTMLAPNTDALITSEERKQLCGLIRGHEWGILRELRGHLKHTSLAHLINSVPAMWVCWHVWSCCLSSWNFKLGNWPKNCEMCLASALTFCYFIISWFCEKNVLGKI